MIRETVIKNWGDTMELNDVVRKIKKLLAIAEDPSASDQEIQLAAYRAEKLMFKYKLDRKDIIEKTILLKMSKNIILRKNIQLI